jgi:hypothetical protein
MSRIFCRCETEDNSMAKSNVESVKSVLDFIKVHRGSSSKEIYNGLKRSQSPPML